MNLTDIIDRATEIMGSAEKALDWLSTPNHALKNRIPLEVVSSPEGIACVNELLDRIDQGVW